MKKAFFLLLLLAGTGACAQTSFYVSPAGNDGNPGTLVSPWQTVQFALDNAIPGCTIYLMNGTYPENCFASVSGTSNSNRIVLTNYNSQSAIIQGTGIPDPLLEIQNVNYFTVSGIEFRNNIGLDASGIMIDGNCTGISILNNRIHDIHFSSNASDPVNANTNSQPLIVNGDSIQPVTDLLIDGNEIYNNRTGYSEALAVNGNVNLFTISNNRVHDNTNIGIDVIGHEGTCPLPALDQARNGSVRWNTCFNNVSAYATSAGIYVDGGASVVIENNSVFANGWGIEAGCENPGTTADAIIIRNNIVFDNNEGGIAIGGYDYPNTGKVIHSQINNNTIVDNNVMVNTSGELVISYCDTVEIFNNIIYTNSSNAPLVSTGAYIPTLSFHNNAYFCTTSPSFNINGNTYSSFAAWSSAIGSEQFSFYANPLFINTTSNDFHLQNTSWCIDHGDSTYSASPGETDLDTMLRIQNGHVDIGADEFGTAVFVMSCPELQSVHFSYDRSRGQVIANFKYPTTTGGKIVISDFTGRIVEVKSVPSCTSDAGVNVSALPSGMYSVYYDQLTVCWVFVK